MTLAAQIRQCRVMANAAEAAGDPEAAAALRARGAELAEQVRVTEAQRQAKKQAEADAYWQLLSGRIRQDLAILSAAGVEFGLTEADFRVAAR